MTLILSLLGAAIALGAAILRMLRRAPGAPRVRDIHRGDWPPDQRAP
jgi:hypothetical protein